MVQSSTDQSRLSRWLGLTAKEEQQSAADIDALARDVIAGKLSDGEVVDLCTQLGITPQALDQRVEEIQQRVVDKKIIKKESALRKSLKSLEADQARENRAYEDSLIEHRRLTDINQERQRELAHELRVVETAKKRLFESAGDAAHGELAAAAQQRAPLARRVQFLKAILSPPGGQEYAYQRADDGTVLTSEPILAVQIAKWERAKSTNAEHFADSDEYRKAEEMVKQIEARREAMKAELAELTEQLTAADNEIKKAESQLITV